MVIPREENIEIINLEEKMKNKRIQKESTKNVETFNAYLAGLIDGDGLINCQITPDPTIKRKFKILPSITIYQKAEKIYYIKELQKELKNIGNIRERKDGMIEYSIKSKPNIKNLILAIQPYLRLKTKQATLILKILNWLEDIKTDSEFLKVCEEVDKFADLNYSKKRIYTTKVIKNLLISPVET